jgi:NADPH:quinone reductase-like Zn-dependent oxidoreductase
MFERQSKERAMSVTTINATNAQEREMPTTPMKAIMNERYGPPSALQLREIDRPAVDADRALIHVRAASINPTDLHGLQGGLVMQLMNRSRRPLHAIPGSDVSGVVVEVGENVTHLRPGDEVYGTCAGSLAEYALGGKNLAPKPANLTFEQAASLPIAGLTALQGLRDKAQLQPGQSVLINGAAGGVGTFAVQIAKAMGAEVTGVCSTDNVEMVRSIGADHVVDYTREDFSRGGQRYDLVFDLVGNRSLSALRRVTKPEGTLLLSGGGHHKGHGHVLRPLALVGRATLVSRFKPPKVVFFICQMNRPDLLALKDLVEAGKVTPVVDRTYPLQEAPEALRYLKTGHARGKLVVSVGS